jgi:hypothetical protein
VDSPSLSRVTCSTRLSVSTWDKTRPHASDTRKPVPEHQQRETAVAGLVVGAFGGGDELVDFSGHQVFAVVHHFVQC